MMRLAGRRAFAKWPDTPPRSVSERCDTVAVIDQLIPASNTGPKIALDIGIRGFEEVHRCPNGI
jgi:hypothetical protein